MKTKKAYVIAEVGVNHQCVLHTALQLIDVAANQGASAVKFQASTVTEEISLKAAPAHFREIAEIVPTQDFLIQCRDFALDRGIEFLCTPSGVESLRFVREVLHCPRLKIASDNLNNVEFLRAARDMYRGHEIILSTGMGSMDEVRRARDILGGMVEVTPIHCVSAYPCPVNRIGLKVMSRMIAEFGCGGLSDHTTSTIVPALAVTLGADIIEKHITLDHSLPGPDHAASLDPGQFQRMMTYIGEAERAMGGSDRKGVHDVEVDGVHRYRKSLVARVAIKAGEQFTEANLTAKRPGSGVSASHWGEYLGYRARRDYAEDELVDQQ